MRTFHVGGTASQVFKQPQIKARNDGTVQYTDLRTVKSLDNNHIVLNKNGSISIKAEDGRELERYTVVIGSVISVPDGGKVKKGETFVQWDPYNVSILTEKAGKIEFRDIIEGVTMKREMDEATKQVGTVIIEHKEDLHPQIVIIDEHKEIIASYSIPAGAHIEVKPEDEGAGRPALGQDAPQGGEDQGHHRRSAARGRALRGAPSEGRRGNRQDRRRGRSRRQRARQEEAHHQGSLHGTEEEHLIPLSKHLIVYKGDVVKKGQQLTEGPVVPHEVLEVCGPQDLQEYLVNEVQEVYRLQGVEINDKHIEIIVRQMLRKVKITEPGDTSFLWGEQIDRLAFRGGESPGRGQGRQARRSEPGAARHHQGLAGDGKLHLGGELPGHHPRPHRCGHAWARSTSCAASRKT